MMYGDVALGVKRELFEHALEDARADVARAKGIDTTRINSEELRSASFPTPRSAEDSLEKIVVAFKAIVRKETGKDFPSDPREQLWGAIDAVFHSWNNHARRRLPPDARHPRRLGHRLHRAGDGLRQPRRHERHGRRLHARPLDRREEALRRVAPERAGRGRGRRASARRSPSRREAAGRARSRRGCPQAFLELAGVADKLEKHFRDVQDIEFTMQSGKLYMLQCRDARSGPARAAVRTAVDMVDEKLITKEEAMLRVDASVPGPAPPPDARPGGPQATARAGVAGEPGRGAGAHRLQRRRGGAARGAGQARHPRADRDLTRGHPRHEGGARHPHRARRDDEPRRRRRARHGQGVRRRVLGRERELRAADDDDHGHDERGIPTENVTLKKGDLITLDGGSGARLRGRRPHRARGAVARVRRAHDVGRRRADDARARQRRHAARRAHGAELRRRGHRPLPHRAHVLRGGAASPRCAR